MGIGKDCVGLYCKAQRAEQWNYPRSRNGDFSIDQKLILDAPHCVLLHKYQMYLF